MKTSKWKEEREVITYISLSPFKYNFYTHSVSFTLMAKLTLEEEGNKTTPKNKITTTPKLWISP